MSVGRTTARAAIWAFLSAAGAKAITLLGLTLLARLLAPAEFGLLAFAMAYMTYVEAIGDLGSGMALVYWPDRRNEAAQVTFVVNVIAGIGWCVLTIALAPFIADAFNAENGAPIVRALAFSFIIKYLGTTHDALTQKDLRFRARLIPDLALASFKAAVALVLAWYGFGAWSLVWGHIAGLTARTLLLWIAVPWRPTFTLPLDLLKPMLGYGRGIIAVNVLAAITHHADLAIVSRFLGTTVLGLYQMAGKIPETTVIVLLWVVSNVLFAAFSRLHGSGESLRRPYLTAIRYVAAITLPSAIGIAMLSKEIVLVFFGPAWIAASPILAALAVHTAIRALSTTEGDVLKASGKANILARLSFAKAILLVPALLFAAQYSATAVALALGGVAAVTAFVNVLVSIRIIGVRLREVARAYMPPATAGAIMAVALVPWLRWSDGFPAPVALFGGVALGAIVYITILLLIDRELVGRAKEHFLARRREPVGGAA